MTPTPWWSSSPRWTRARPRGVATERARHRRARARPRQRRRVRRVPRDRRATRDGARPPRLERHRVDRRVRSRPGERHRARTGRPAERVRAPGGRAVRAFPKEAPSLVCGEGAMEAARLALRRRGRRGHGAVPPRRRRLEAASRGACRVARSGSGEQPTGPGPTADPRTRTQVAVVAGGHPAVDPLASGARQRSRSSTRPTGHRRSPRCSSSELPTARDGLWSDSSLRG